MNEKTLCIILFVLFMMILIFAVPKQTEYVLENKNNHIYTKLYVKKTNQWFNTHFEIVAFIKNQSESNMYYLNDTPFQLGHYNVSNGKIKNMDFHSELTGMLLHNVLKPNQTMEQKTMFLVNRTSFKKMNVDYLFNYHLTTDEGQQVDEVVKLKVF